jgi:hypothetical protein
MPLYFQIPVFLDSNWQVFIIHLFISIPTYIVLYLIFQKRIADKLKRNIITVFSTIVLTPFIYTWLIITFFSLLFYEPKMKFDQTIWEENKNERYQMGEDLVKSKILIGKDTSDVKLLLGQPTWKDSLNRSWTYDMGTGSSGFSLIFHSLTLNFNKSQVMQVEHSETKD